VHLSSAGHKALCQLQVDEVAVKARQTVGASLACPSEATSPLLGLRRRQKLLEVSSSTADSPVVLKKVILLITVDMAMAGAANLVGSPAIDAHLEQPFQTDVGLRTVLFPME